jgi:hypothetical protein
MIHLPGLSTDNKSKKLFILITIGIFIVTFLILKSQQAQQQTTTTSGEAANVIGQMKINEIRNQPFPMAGDDNNERNNLDEPSISEKYSIGGALVTFNEGVRAKVTFYTRGDTLTRDYGYSPIFPSSKTNGTYIDARLNLENQTKEPLEIIAGDIKLIDQDNRQYFPVKQMKECGIQNDIPQEAGLIDQLLNPGVPCEIGLLFEVSTSTKTARIELQVKK